MMARVSFCLVVPILVGLAPVASEEEATPLPIGHRGLLHHAPENTLAGFQACIDLKIGFELDVRRAGDGTLICLHDETVDRTTDGHGNVRILALDDIKTLDAGSWFDPAFSGEGVPTLEEVLSLLVDRRGAGRLVAVDLKDDDDRMATDVVEMARRLGVLDQLVFIGLAIVDPDLRQRLRKADPGAKIARLVESSAEFEESLDDPNCDWIYIRAIPSRDEVGRAREAGKRVFIAGPLVAGLESANWQEAAASGVDAALTDYPLEFRSIFRSIAPQR